MYPMAPPRNRKTMMNGGFLASFQIVPRNGRRFVNMADAALFDGGVGGREDRTPKRVSKKPEGIFHEMNFKYL